MKKCKCWETIKSERMLSDFEKGVIFAQTGLIVDQDVHIKQVCNGTRECDECSCGGDKKRCNFYPKKKGIKK